MAPSARPAHIGRPGSVTFRVPPPAARRGDRLLAFRVDELRVPNAGRDERAQAP